VLPWFCGEEVVGRCIETQDGKHEKTLFIGIVLSPGFVTGAIVFLMHRLAYLEPK